MEQAVRFIPLMITTLALAITSFVGKRNKRLPWLIVAFIIWLIALLFTIGVFDR